MSKIPWLKQKTDKQLLKRKIRLDKRKASGNYYLDRISLTMAKNSLYRLQLRNKPTEAEILVGNYLFNELKIPFQFQRGFVKPFHRIADFYLVHLRVIIEVDGGYHKNTILKDRQKDILWENLRDIKTIRVTNEEVFDGSFIDKLKSLKIKEKGRVYLGIDLY